MKKHRLNNRQREDPPTISFSEESLISEVKRQLGAMMKAQVGAHLLDEQDARILSLRMGLENGQCATLNEVSQTLHISPEKIRQRQYLALKKNVKDLRFFKLLQDYARLVKLPRGVTYYLLRYSDDPENDIM